MQINVGPHTYDLILHHGLIPFQGKLALGLCDPARCQIMIADVVAPRKRLSVLWHELAHAWWAELSPDPDLPMGEEALARMIGVAMANLDSRTLARGEVLLHQGLECDDVMFFAGVPIPVAVIHWRSPVLVHHPADSA